MNDNQNLNPDAIYAAMAWLREYVESPQGQEEFKAHLDKRDARPNELHAWIKKVASEAGGTFHAIPKVHLSYQQTEEIYPGEPISVEVGIGFARNLIWGSPNFSTSILQGTDSEGAPIREALSRFIADRAN